MTEYASIFNDVLGPVMVGPSSSHTAASVRIGKSLRQMVKGKIVYFQALVLHETLNVPQNRFYPFIQQKSPLY